MTLTMKQTLTACLALALALVVCDNAAAQNQPSSDLLVPYFEVDANPAGVTTLFAVGNSTEKPVDVLATVFTNWGIPILKVPFTLQSREVRTVNLRDWFRNGGDPKKALAAAEVDHLKAAASGQRSPKDNLYYSTEVELDMEVGYVTLRTQGDRPDALWGDWFLVDVNGNLARGDVLVSIDRSIGCPGLCKRHLLRYLSGGGFDGGTDVIIWREAVGQPSANPEGGVRIQTDATAISEPGLPIENRLLSLLPVEKVTVDELGLKEPFGSLDVESEVETFIAVQHSAENRYSVGLTTYCLPQKVGPDIDIVKLTNGADANEAPGPSIPVGGAVTWEYLVRNTGGVELTGIVVTDDQGETVSCPGDTLAPGKSMTCKATGVAEACQYANVGTATGQPPTGPEVSASDPSHYFGEEGADLALKVLLDGKPAGTAPGPTVQKDSQLNWSFEITNTGKVRLTGIKLQGIAATCPGSQLDPGKSMTCTAKGTALKGEQSLAVEASGKGSCASASANAVGHYTGDCPGCDENPEPGIEIIKLTNGDDANVAPGPHVPVGSPVTWTYKVTNIGELPLDNVKVTDDDTGVAVTCPKTSLAVDELMLCSGSGFAQACQYKNIGTASGKDITGKTVIDDDPSHYFGDTHPAIQVETAVNGNDADTPKGPEIPEGSALSFTYVVKNTGDVALSDIKVNDSKGVAVSCPNTTLQPGQSMTCTGNGNAIEGQYSAIGTATGKGSCDLSVSDDDPVHYWGEPTGGGEGCTPGYWKNHEDSWQSFSTSQKVSSVFGQASLYPALGSSTLLQALAFQGGSTLEGAAEILLRAATASLLNSVHNGVDFPWITSQVIHDVDAALASMNRDTMISLASALDKDNNLGCPLN